MAAGYNLLVARAVCTEPLPVISHNCVFHVGEMNRSIKRPNSYEGSGLSVSQCPSSWTRIAKLGGRPTWSLRKDNSQFLDAHRVSRESRTKIRRWGIDQALIVMKKCVRVSFIGGEDGERYEAIYDNLDKAKQEHDEQDGTWFKNQTLAVPTRQLRLRTHCPGAGPAIAEALLLTVFAQHNDFDGVWWNDRLAPCIHSAPRGVIFNKKLRGWNIQLAKPDDFEFVIDDQF